MAYFDDNVLTLLRDDLDMSYEDMSFGDQLSAIFGLFKKKDMSGDGVKVPFKGSVGGGQGGTAATAYANATLANRYAYDVVPPFKCYGESIIDLSQSVFTEGKENSVVDELMDESKTAMDAAKIQLDAALCSDGSGKLGKISTATNTSGTTWDLVLTMASDINHFFPNQVLVAKATPFAAALQTGSLLVTAVKASSNTITVTAQGGATPTATHVIGLQGTMAASTAIVTFAGIPAFIPPIPAGGTRTLSTLFGLNQALDERRCAGSALDGSGMSILEGINKLAHMVAQVPGARPDMLPCSFATLGKVQADLGTQARYVDVKGNGIDVFYKLLTINGPTGPMYFVPSANWADDLVGVLTSDSWTLGAPGNKPFRPATSNGNPIVDIPGLDKAVAQYRCAAFAYTDAPGENGMLTISP
jgi:hypothetical protein